MARAPTDDELRARIADHWAVDLGDTPIRSELATTDGARLALAERLALVIEGAGGAVQPPPRAVPWRPLPHRDVVAPPADVAVRELLAWASKQGIDAGAIDVRIAADGNRSVVARRALAEGDVLVAVPRSALITDLDVADAPIGTALARAAPPLDSLHTPFGLWLAIERRDPSSRWRPYLDALPARVGLPWFDADPERALRGTHCELVVDALRGSVQADHAAIVARMPRVADLTVAELAWGRAITSSRLFRVNIGGHDRTALAPVADLFDHGPADATWSYDQGGERFVIRATRALAAGAPVHLSYGKKGLSRFVTGYGFAPADVVAAVGEPVDDPAHEDVAALTFAGYRDDVRAALALHLIWGHDLDRPLTMTVGESWDERARRVLSVARLLVADGRELTQAVERGRFQRGELAWLGPRNERAALERIADEAGAARTRLAATDDADRRLLAEPEARGWARTAAAIRVSERAVLERWSELAVLASGLHGERSPWSWRRTADQRESDGLRHPLANGYLRALADELPP